MYCLVGVDILYVLCAMVAAVFAFLGNAKSLEVVMNYVQYI